jgi:hypothetical protein
LLVASEEVDRFYSEYGLGWFIGIGLNSYTLFLPAFNYEFVQIYDPLEQRHYHQQQGAFGGEFPSGKHPSPKKVKYPFESKVHMPFSSLPRHHSGGKTFRRIQSSRAAQQKEDSQQQWHQQQQQWKQHKGKSG